MALDATQREELIALIDREMARLRAEVQEGIERSGRTAPYSALTGEAYDSGDQAVADLLTDVEIAEVKRDMSAIEALEAARGRALSGVADTCIDCGGEIPFARLRANPAARRCRSCQEQYESTHALSAAAQR